MDLALFDFDGTITDRDSLFDFLRFTFGSFRCAVGALVLSPVLALYIGRFIPNWRAKESVFRHFLGGLDAGEFRRAALRYSLERLPEIVRPLAVERIEWHRRKGHRILVVSASVEDWMEGWCAKLGLELIGTRLESREGRITGKIEGRNCNGPEKVRRIREAVDLDRCGRIYAYGNSDGDRDMLALADERYYDWERI